MDDLQRVLIERACERLVTSYYHLVDHGEVSLLPPDPVRLRQRMNLDQLAAAIAHTTGGLAWTEGTGANTKDLFTVLAPTLGKPDFNQITQEDLSPSSLFQKFMDDMARDVCAKMAVADAADMAAARAKAAKATNLAPSRKVFVKAQRRVRRTNAPANRPVV